jgi:hypothetical protein
MFFPSAENFLKGNLHKIEEIKNRGILKTSESVWISVWKI